MHNNLDNKKDEQQDLKLFLDRITYATNFNIIGNYILGVISFCNIFDKFHKPNVIECNENLIHAINSLDKLSDMGNKFFLGIAIILILYNILVIWLAKTEYDCKFLDIFYRRSFSVFIIIFCIFCISICISVFY